MPRKIKALTQSVLELASKCEREGAKSAKKDAKKTLEQSHFFDLWVFLLRVLRHGYRSISCFLEKIIHHGGTEKRKGRNQKGEIEVGKQPIIIHPQFFSSFLLRVLCASVVNPSF